MKTVAIAFALLQGKSLRPMTSWALTGSISPASSHNWESIFDLKAAEQSAQAKAAPD